MGRIEFDGSMVTIEKTARGRVQFPVSSVSSVMLVPAGFGMTGIKFTVSGATEVQNVKALGSHKDIAKDPYGLTFRKKNRPDFENLVEHINYARVNPGHKV